MSALQFPPEKTFVMQIGPEPTTSDAFPDYSYLIEIHPEVDCYIEINNQPKGNGSYLVREFERVIYGVRPRFKLSVREAT